MSGRIGSTMLLFRARCSCVDLVFFLRYSVLYSNDHVTIEKEMIDLPMHHGLPQQIRSVTWVSTLLMERCHCDGAS